MDERQKSKQSVLLAYDKKQAPLRAQRAGPRLFAMELSISFVSKPYHFGYCSRERHHREAFAQDTACKRIPRETFFRHVSRK